MKKLNTIEFINKARSIHNDKYDYSNTNYINYNTKIEIICLLHGSFWQTPNAHLQAQGCLKCNGGVKSTTAEFINKARSIHNNKYNYSKFIYYNNRTKGIIICSLHGDFLQTPHEHLSGCGCQVCSGKIEIKYDKFVDLANKKHNFKYKYFPEEYINYKTKTKIKCPLHGYFTQLPICHVVSGHGCSECGGVRKSNTENFIKNATKIFKNRYDYSKVNYINNKTKIEIKCLICNKTFWQRPNDHLSKYGCPFCISIISKPEIKFLNYMNVPDSKETRQVKILRKKVDGYDPKTNTIYEFLGDYWHGNPKKYNSTDINKKTHKTFGQLYNETMNKLKKIKCLGYNIKYVWESDWKLWVKNKNCSLLVINF